MNDSALNLQLINNILDKLTDVELTKIAFRTKFEHEMTRVSCLTLVNINTMIEEYRHDHDVNKSGDKALLLFGILQGLFVGIDSVYTIGKATGLNKLLINLNQNQALRQIKQIRNDVVGHPSYRYYENNAVGFCALDLNRVVQTKISYNVYTFEANKMQVKNIEVDILDSINNYYLETNEILRETINYFTLLTKANKPELVKNIITLANQYLSGKNNIALLQTLKAELVSTFDIIKEVSNRALWRLNLINYLFNIPKPNEYLRYLTLQEMYKLYSLIFGFEKKLNPKLTYQFPLFPKNQEFKMLRIKVIECKQLDRSLLHDPSHPLYYQNMKVLINNFINDASVNHLVKWIKTILEQNEHKLLYLIGSELKK
jgi:hypothetical protein